MAIVLMLPKLLTPLHVTAAQHAGDVARAYRESFREFLLELSNSELEGDVLVVRRRRG
jgi:hypothetical protein